VKKALLVLGVGVALAGCGSSDSGGGGGDKYPDSARKAFLDACTKSAGGGSSADDRCNCVIDKLEENVSFDDFKKADEALRQGKSVDSGTQDEIEKATSDCRKDG
jgi:hypothetical protein